MILLVSGLYILYVYLVCFFAYKTMMTLYVFSLI